MRMDAGELCGSSAVIARDSCSVKSSVTDHRHHHHPHHHVQQQQQQPASQLHQPTSHQSTAPAAAAVAAAHSLQQSCYDEQRRLQTHQHRQHQQRQPGDADRVVAPSSADCVALQPQQRVAAAAAGTDGVLRHQLDHYADTAAAKLIKSEPNDSTMAAVVATAVGEARKMGEAKSNSGGRTAVGSTSNSVTTTSADNTVESLLHGVSSTSLSSSSLNDAISRHHHHHHSQQQQQQQVADMQQTSSFTVSSLVHPTNGRNAGSSGAFASVVDDDQGRDVSVDGVLNSIDRAGGVVESDSTCFDQSAAAAAAAQWFAHQGSAQPVGYSSRCTPEFYMQRLHASIAADRRHSVAAAACIGLGDADVDGTVPPSTPAFNHHAAGGGYAAWYGAAQSADAVCLPSAGSNAYIAGGGLHDMFDVSAATRMLSTRQSCAQLQTDSPFRAYYGSGAGITHGPTAYAAYAEDCTSAKY